MMNIPEYPGHRPLALEDKPLFDEVFRDRQPELSQYTFTNLFAWRRARNTQVARLKDSLLVFFDLPDRRVFCEPMGGSARDVIEECFRSPGGKAIEFKYLSWNAAQQFQSSAEFRLELDRENSDYLYAAKDMVDLAGGRYDAKRNFIKRFSSEHDYRYRVVTPELAEACREFEERWCTDRSCQSDEGLSHEQDAIVEMLVNWTALGIQGGALEVDGSIVAFALGEALNRETLVVHVEKADAKLTGIYAVINNEFARSAGAGFEFINREQDLGIIGLRRAKQSYHPARMIDAYRITK